MVRSHFLNSLQAFNNFYAILYIFLRREFGTDTAPANFERITIHTISSIGIYIISTGANPLTLRDIILKDYVTYSLYVVNSANRYLIDCDDKVFENVGIYAVDYGAYYTYHQYSFNLHVVDENGNNISGVVTLKDTNGDTTFSVSTAADGTITEQNVTHTSWDYYPSLHTLTYNPYNFNNCFRRL